MPMPMPEATAPTTTRGAAAAAPAPPPAPSAPTRGIVVPEPVAILQDREPARPPMIRITAPSATEELTTEDSSITLAGTARDAVSIEWTTNYGASGTAIGTDRWSVPNFKLPVGTTVLTLTARNAVGDLTSDRLTVTRRVSNPIQLDITAPTADPAWSTPSSTVALRGVASDNVVRVTWNADWGGSGTATGTGTWTIATIGLQRGRNRITITAYDADGRMQRKVLSVDYRPQVASSR